MHEDRLGPAADSSLAPLLEPSLEPGSLERPLFSVRANFFVAFFGGVYATALFSSINSERMGRLRKDLWLSLVAVLAWSVVIWLMGRAIAEDAVPKWIELAPFRPASTVRHTGKLVALAFFGVHYLRRRAFYQAQSLAGVDAPNPWLLGLASIGVAILATLVVMALGIGFARG